MLKIREEHLERWFGPASEQLPLEERFLNADELGGLAPWWLTAEELDCLDPVARKRMGVAYPRVVRLSDEPGACRVLILVHMNTPLLRPAVVLPLQWRKDRRQHDRGLPTTVRNLADQVVAQWSSLIRRASMDGQVTWTLHFAVERPPDLSELSVGAQSAWASLAGGLVLATEGIRPKNSVWATVAWDDKSGVALVDLGEDGAKLRTAAEFGAERLFVSYQTEVEATGLAQRHKMLGQVVIRPLFGAASDREPPSAAAILRPYLSDLRREPIGPSGSEEGVADPFEVRKRFYLQMEDRRKARQWFYEHLLKDVVGIAQAAESARALPAVDDLVVVASAGLEVASILCGVMRPQRLCIWYDPVFLPVICGGGATETTLHNELGRALCFLELMRAPQILPLALPTPRHEELSQAFQAFFRQTAQATERAMMVDVTLGTSLMSASLAESAPRGTWIVYMHNDAEPVTDRKFFSSIECWQKDN